MIYIVMSQPMKEVLKIVHFPQHFLPILIEICLGIARDGGPGFITFLTTCTNQQHDNLGNHHQIGSGLGHRRKLGHVRWYHRSLERGDATSK